MCFFLPFQQVKATDISYPYTFVNGQILPASQLNGNFTAVTTVVNGGITNGNINASASIAPSKMNATLAYPLILQAAATNSFSTGNTGDTVGRWAATSDGWLKFGPGGATAVDVTFVRSGVGTLAVRNGTNAADAALTCSTLAASTSVALTNGFTLTLTPAAMAAARAITVVDPLTSANLIFSTGSLTNHGVLYTDGTNIKSTAAGGSGTTVLASVAGADPAFIHYSGGFGGDGSDGAVTATGTVTTPVQKNATTFQVNNAATYTVPSGTNINCTSTFTIGQGASGALTVAQGAGGGAGGSAAYNFAGNGSGQGGGQNKSKGGGGGANVGYGGNGGETGNAGPQTPAAGTGSWYPSGGGGAGGSWDGANNGGAGGNGGGRLVICAVGAIVLSSGSTVSAVGTAGTAAAGGNSSGGGGGAGGTIIFASQTSTSGNGTVTVAGGVGGNGAGTGGGGGGGGGGCVLQWSPSLGFGGTITVSAGGNSNLGGLAGGTGSHYTLAGTPNLPLLGWVEKHIDQFKSFPVCNLKQRDVAALAANGDVVKYMTYMSGSLTETCEGIGDSEVLDNAS